MDNIINRTIKALSMIVLLCLGTYTARASHYAAADLYLTYIGAGVNGCTGTTEYKYTVTFDIYKACEAGNAGLPGGVVINYGSLNAGFNDVLQMNNPRIDTLDGLCDNFKKDNSCRVPTNDKLPGFVRHRFEATLTLPSAQTDWRFWWRDGNRNSAIQNIQNPSGTWLYIEAGLNNLTKYNNSTPRFVIDPLPYICVNQPATYLNGPYDPNGDSLNITSQTPFDNVGVPLTYAGGYSLNNPLAATFDNPYKVNTLTGTATFTPTQQGLFVLGFRCDEYERGTGIPLGYIMRDVQISVLQCNAPPPPLDSLPSLVNEGSIVKAGNQGNAVFVCPGSDMNFDMTTTSPVTTSSVYMEANTSTIPGSQFSTVGDGTSSVTGTFSWTPTQADIGEHTLIITSKDSTCTGNGFSIVLKNYTVLLIKVVNGIDAGPDLPICAIGPKEQQLFVKGADFLRVNWTDISGGPAIGLNATDIHNPIADPKHAATYIVSTPDLKGRTCKVKDTVGIYIDTSNAITTLPKNPVIQCRPDYVQLEALIKGKPPVSNVKCGLSQPTSCTNPDVLDIYGSEVYGQIGYDTTGATSPIMNNDQFTKKIQYLVRRDEMHNLGMRSATINQIGVECLNGSLPLYNYNNFTISIKCTEKDELKASDGFETGLIEVYYSASELLDNQWHNYKLNKPYNWDTTKNLIIEICYSENDYVVTNCSPASGNPPILRYAPTTYVSGLVLTPNDINIKGVCNVVNSADIEGVAARPVFRFTYCEADPQPFTINWTPGKYLSDSTIEQPLAYVPQSTDYVVETFGRSGCIIRDTISIYVPKHDFDVFPKDSSICFGDKTIMNVTNGFSYRWYEYDANNDTYNDATSINCADCEYVIANPKKTTTYRISVSDSVWCYDTLETRLNVLPLPDVRLLNSDTTIKYGQSIKLLATGARMYNWTPVSTLNNPNISYPIATPTEATRYIVGGLGANGCRAFDTLYVSVDYRDHLFVPSAFSPNGDGKNDIFRVANITFQKVLEFRVYNRWGQEIFSTSGSNVGWDGTWKGVPQDMGTYNYIIRVASPDGQTDTYKGEVTLIR